MNKRSDVSRGVRKSGSGPCSPHRGSCCRKQPPVPAPRTGKKTHPPPPPTKLPDIKLRPSRARTIWPVAPDGFIPNSVIRSSAPFPPRGGSTTRARKTGTLEEKRDFLTESVTYIDGLIKKYEKTAEEEEAKKKPSGSFAKMCSRGRGDSSGPEHYCSDTLI